MVGRESTPVTPAFLFQNLWRTKAVAIKMVRVQYAAAAAFTTTTTTTFLREEP